MDVFEKIEKLPVDVKEFFHSNEVRLAMERACFLYDISEEDMDELTGTIGDIFLENIQMAKLPELIQEKLEVSAEIAQGISFELNSKIFYPFADYFKESAELMEKWNTAKLPPFISEEEAHSRILAIEPWILEQEDEERAEGKKQQAEAVKQQAKIDNLALGKALEKYPNLGEQAVTLNLLKIQGSLALVKPSIKNWINDYHSALGSGKHSTIDRGNYLFHSENGKRLTPGERQKVSLVLKSLDEESLLEIDGDAQQIIFKLTVETPVQNNNFPAQQPTAPVMPRATHQSAPNIESAPEDVAQARIRQSLDFSKNVAPRKENEGPKLTFEDANYAEQLRTRIKTGSVQSPIKEKNELPGQSEGNLRFSSAQELPAEKELTSQQRSVTLPTHSIRENQPEKDAQTWNSPDFRQHLVQEKKAEESLPEKEPIAPAVQNQVVKMPKVYSPYIISPAHHYLAGQAEAPAPSPQPGQNDPKIKGNMVDLS
jgi:hypothetical protein